MELLLYIGNIVGVYLKHDVKLVKTKCLGQIAAEQTEDIYCSFCNFERERERER